MTCSDIPLIYDRKHRYVAIFVRVASGQEISREKILEGRGKVRDFYFESGKIDIFKKSQGKFEII